MEREAEETGSPAMKNFLILTTGNGRGCDYTLDCNKTWHFVQANSIAEAMKNLADEMWGKLDDYGGDYENHWYRHNETYHTFQFLEVGDLRTISAAELVAEHYKSAMKAARAKAEEEREANERAEYERLQKKFGAKT